VQSPIGRDDINVVRLQRDGFSDLGDWHVRARSQDVWHLTVQIRIEMHDHDKGGAGFLGQRVEQKL
jgi:hypothetical protein